MPRPRIQLGIFGAIIEAAIVKVFVGEDTDIGVHAVLNTQQLDSIRVRFLDTLEKTLLIGKDGGSLRDDSGRQLIRI